MRAYVIAAASSCLLLAFAATIAASAASAQSKRPTKTSEPSAEAREAARAAYARGQSAFAEGRFAEAKAAFEAAFAAIPNPLVLLGIAESQARLGEVIDAIASFERYLELRPDAPDRAEVVARRDELARTPARLTVRSTPEGVELAIDGEPVGEPTPTQLELPAGEHELQYSRRGYRGGTEVVTLPPGATRELQLSLEPLEPEPALAQAATDFRELEDMEAMKDETTLVTELDPLAVSVRETPTTALWVTGGIGAASIVAGTVLGFLALQERSDFQSNPTRASADRGERLALFADVAFGVGAMALITTAVLYFTQDEPPFAADVSAAREKETTRAQARLEIVPALSPSSAAATARLRF